MVPALAALVLAADPHVPLRFAWPERAAAIVELTTERRVGEVALSVVVRSRLDVAPEAPPGHRLVRFSKPTIVSIDGVPFAKARTDTEASDVARVVRSMTPSFVVDDAGRYLEARDADRMIREVLAAVGLPDLPFGMSAFAGLVGEVAPRDWQMWVELWIGDALLPGEWTRLDRVMPFEGALAPVTLIRKRVPPVGGADHTRLLLEAEYPSDAVRTYTTGVLLDLAIEAERLGDDVRANRKWIESARFSPVEETITAELETATLRPIVVERVRSFFAENDGFRVEGTERRVHRFEWLERGVGD
ncbi:MAG TPA: hypothetical protein VF139_09705 [Candidatus Polarisedimenticolaceae bacterium]